MTMFSFSWWLRRLPKTGGSTPSSPTTMDSPILRVPSGGSHVPPIDRQKVIALAKEKSEKSKKKDEKDDARRPEAGVVETMVLQRMMLNEIFHANAEEMFTALFGSPAPTVKPPARKEFVASAWEDKDSLKARVVTYTDTVKISSKDKERYLTCKFRETQMIAADQKE